MTTDAKTAYHHGNLRAVLLDVAQDMLEEGGIASLSLRAVAKRAGVSHAAPYRHFDSKDELLEAIAARGFNALESAIASAERSFPDDPQEQLFDAGLAYVREAIARPHRARLMFGGDLQLGEQNEAARRAFEALVTAVRRGRRAGVFEPAPTRETVLGFWASAHGLAMLIIGQQMRYLDLEIELPRLWRAALQTRLCSSVDE